MSPSRGAPEHAPPSAKRYEWFAPRPVRAPWLAHLWVQEAPAEPAPPTTVVPSNHVELVVRLRDPFAHAEVLPRSRVDTMTRLATRSSRMP